MRTTKIVLAALAILLSLPSLYAQEKPAPEAPPAQIPLKIQIVLTEYAGTQKVSTLPYTLYTIAYPSRGERHDAQLRFGVQVPMGDTYHDVGTNIDCWALQTDDSRVSLDFTVERTSVTVRGSNGEEAEWKPGDEGLSPHPLLRNFRDSFHLVMRDGATMEGTAAVDPVTGHVLKIDVTLNILK